LSSILGDSWYRYDDVYSTSVRVDSLIYNYYYTFVIYTR
jgi:hypothetical protein